MNVATFLGQSLYEEGNYEEALHNYERARSLSKDKNSYAIDIATVLVKLGKFEKAESTLLENANASEIFLSEGYVGVYATNWLRLVDFYIGTGKLEEAQEYIDVIRPTLESRNYDGILSDSQNKIYALSNRSENGALERLRRLENAWGRYSSAVIEPANILAQAYDQEGNYSEAAELYERIVEICRSSSDEVDPINCGIVKINYAFNQFKLENLDSIEQYIDDAIEALGVGHQWIVSIVPQVAQEYLNRQRLIEAKKYMLIYINILKADEVNNKDEILETEKFLNQLDAHITK